jgi:hypothetical protein
MNASRISSRTMEIILHILRIWYVVLIPVLRTVQPCLLALSLGPAPSGGIYMQFETGKGGKGETLPSSSCKRRQLTLSGTGI